MNTAQYNLIRNHLLRLGAASEYLDLHEGKRVPRLDQHIRRLPDGWCVAPRPENIDGRAITPLFLSIEFDIAFCLDESTEKIVAINPYAPWPPLKEYESWCSFVAIFVCKLES